MNTGTPNDAAMQTASEIFCRVPGEAASGEKRRQKRQRVLKAGQLIFGYAGSTIDCLITDETQFGVMAETAVAMEIPPQIKIRFIGGVTFDALRRWAAGNKIGLEFVGGFADNQAMDRQRRAAGVVLREAGVGTAVKMLREARFLGNAELQSIAEAAEFAYARLESMLV